MVAGLEGSDESLPTWITKNMDTEVRKTVIVTLNVHYYQPYVESTWFTSQYSGTYQGRRRSRFNTPWKDNRFNRICRGHIFFSEKVKKSFSVNLKVYEKRTLYVRGDNHLLRRKCGRSPDTDLRMDFPREIETTGSIPQKNLGKCGQRMTNMEQVER